MITPRPAISGDSDRVGSDHALRPAAGISPNGHSSAIGLPYPTQTSPRGGAPPASTDLTFRPFDAAGRDASVRALWERLLERIPRLNRIFSTPTWAEHLQNTRTSQSVQVGEVRKKDGQLLGLVPVHCHPIELTFAVARKVVGRLSFQTVDLLGSEPLLPSGVLSARELFEGALRAFPEAQGVYCDTLPLNSDLWRELRDAKLRGSGFFPYVPGGPKPLHWIEMGTSFEGYLKKMTSKGRYNLRRQVRELGKHVGAVDLLRVENPDEVERFLVGATEVGRSTWQNRMIGEQVGTSAEYVATYKSLASRGMLRSYLLRCNGRPTAFAVGFQHCDLFLFEQIGFDEKVAHYSPGTCLLYLLLEDLFRDQTPAVFSFGPGDALYKRRFGNRVDLMLQLFLFRNSVYNRLAHFTHAGFRTGVDLTKQAVGWLSQTAQRRK